MRKVVVRNKINKFPGGIVLYHDEYTCHSFIPAAGSTSIRLYTGRFRESVAQVFRPMKRVFGETHKSSRRTLQTLRDAFSTLIRGYTVSAIPVIYMDGI